MIRFFVDLPSRALLFAVLLLLSAEQATAAVGVDYLNVIADPPDATGTNSFATDQDLRLWADRWQESGVEIIRIQLPQFFLEPVNDDADPNTITWSNFQFGTAIPIPPDFTRTITFASLFAAMRDAGVTIQINPVYLAGWLSSNPVPAPYMGFPGEAFARYPANDLDEYYEYIYAVLYYLVNTVGYPAERIMLDVINEPDLGCGADPAVPCFWDNWTMSDIVAVVQTSDAAIQAVDSRIRMVGVAECCGTSIARDLMDNYNGAQYLSGLTYHRYVSSDFSSGISRGNTLASYGLPVYCNEYGSLSHYSDGVNGALWHAYALPLMWSNGISPLQFPFAENPYSSDPYNSMGLMFDWTTGWGRKPAYWVYANFNGNFPGKELVAVTPDAGLDALAARSTSAGGGAELSLWISNWSGSSLVNHAFSIDNYPASEAVVSVFDNLSSTSPVATVVASGSPLVFDYTIAASSSYTFAIAPIEASTPSLGPLATACLLVLLLAVSVSSILAGQRKAHSRA